MLINSVTTITFLSLLLNSTIPYPGIVPEPVPVETSFYTAEHNPQTLTVSSSVTVEPLERESYAATTPQEISQKKQAEAEAAAKQAEAEANQQQSMSVYVPVFNGTVCWPVTDFTYSWDVNGFRTPTRPTHNGFDMLAPALTPIYAAVAGTVRVSQDGYYNYGAAVVVDSNMEGQQISTLYAHMTYGTRAVQPGQHVEAGQLLGLVGMTGYATANHLHFEVKLNGANIDPYLWLQTNT